MNATQPTSFWRRPRDGEALWILGGLYTWKARGAETGGAYSLCEVQGPPGFAIPLHYHEREHESFYVADGLVTLVLDDDQLQLPAGGFGLAPAGVRHCFRLDSDSSRLLLLITPGAAGHEGMFAEMGQPAATPVIPPPPAEPPDPERLIAIAARYGTVTVGPPPS